MESIEILFVLLFILILVMLSLITLKIQATIKDKIQLNLICYINGILIYQTNININYEKLIILFYNNKGNHINKYNNSLKEIAFALLRKLHIVQLSMIINIGLSDAAITCISSGILWNIIIYLLLYAKSKDIKINNFNISINPKFDDLIFNVSTVCIIKIRIGYIIWESIKVIYNILFRR